MKLNLNLKDVKFKINILNVLVGVFLVLFVVAFYPQIDLFIRKNILKTASDKIKEISLLGITPLSEANVDSISIKSATGAFVIQKTASGWMLEGKKVSNSQISALFAQIRNLEVGDLLSKNPKNHLELGVDTASGYFLTLRSGSTDYAFVVGNPASITGSFYIRKADDNSVYIAKGGLRELVTAFKEDWLDKSIVNIPFDQIAKIDVLASNSFSVIKKDDGKLVKSVWGTETEISQENTTRLTNLFSLLMGDRILNDAEKAEFDKTAFKNVVVFFDKNNETITKLDVVPHEQAWWVAETGSDDAFEVNGLSTLMNL